MEVNQQKNGGRWVRVGEYEMEAGDDYSVEFSCQATGDDCVAADAVKVKKILEAAPAGKPPRATAPRQIRRKYRRLSRVARTW